jgi:hypothetical protein
MGRRRDELAAGRNWELGIDVLTPTLFTLYSVHEGNLRKNATIGVFLQKVIQYNPAWQATCHALTAAGPKPTRFATFGTTRPHFTSSGTKMHLQDNFWDL